MPALGTLGPRPAPRREHASPAKRLRPSRPGDSSGRLTRRADADAVVVGISDVEQAAANAAAMRPIQLGGGRGAAVTAAPRASAARDRCDAAGAGIDAAHAVVPRIHDVHGTVPGNAEP